MGGPFWHFEAEFETDRAWNFPRGGHRVTGARGVTPG
jgi:hypothetical protein